MLINLAIATVRGWARWLQRRRAHHELMALDDRLLADIGIQRTDIPAIFDEKVRREGVGVHGAAMALSALQTQLVFGHRALPPMWPPQS